jgi:predicted nucleotidyltransferase
MSLSETLQSNREQLFAIAHRFGARNVRVFGSLARGQERPGSDLDLLVDMAPGRSLLDLIGLEQEITDLLGCTVDIVVEGGISPYLEPQILAEAKPL